MNISIRDIQEFQEHFVKPMVDAVTDQIKPLIAEVAEMKADVAKLKSNQKRAMVGWGVFSAGLAAAMGYGKAAAMSYFKKQL